MSFCPCCGAAINASARLCAGCGAQILNGENERTVQEPTPYAAPAPRATTLHEDAFESDEIPSQLQAFVAELEEWAILNDRDARMDTLRFWSLKIPTILSSALAGVLAVTHLNTIAAMLAAFASACVLIDAVNPGGQLRNAHLRAVHDLRGLQHRIMKNWRIGILRDKAGNCLAAEILESAQKIRDKITADLRAVETSFARTVKTK
jgi:hypothetical protein